MPFAWDRSPGLGQRLPPLLAWSRVRHTGSSKTEAEQAEERMRSGQKNVSPQEGKATLLLLRRIEQNTRNWIPPQEKGKGRGE